MLKKNTNSCIRVTTNFSGFYLFATEAHNDKQPSSSTVSSDVQNSPPIKSPSGHSATIRVYPCSNVKKPHNPALTGNPTCSNPIGEQGVRYFLKAKYMKTDRYTT